MAGMLQRGMLAWRARLAVRGRATTRGPRRTVHGSGRSAQTVAGKEELVIFDTTLRDGEQTPGVTLSEPEKVLIAQHLSRLGVTVCEAGFPIASEGDFRAVQTIAREVGHMTEQRADGSTMRICGLARAKEGDIERCYEAVEPAKKSRIHLFLATSDIHLEHKLNITREECLRQIADMVAFARSLCEDIEFSPEDAGRSDMDFLIQALGVAIESGATTLNIPDTVGYNLPSQYGARMATLIEKTKGSAGCIWSAHCHNDLGLATANTLAGVIDGGARQAEVTINGIGERAGNTALEEVVMALRVHDKTVPVYTNINTRMITPTSQLVSKLTRVACQINKAVVGANAFAHESGIHQDGMIKNQETYEIMDPEMIGLTGHTGMVLGKLSGKNAVATRLEELGFTLSGSQLKELFVRFKRLADAKRGVSDDDLRSLVRSVFKTQSDEPRWKLRSINVFSTMHDPNPTQTTTSLTITNPDTGMDQTVALVATGSVETIYSAISSIVGFDCTLRDYRIDAVSPGSDSIGEVTVHVSPTDPETGKPSSQVFSGFGADADIVVASAKAYINSINAIAISQRHPLDGQKRSAPV